MLQKEEKNWFAVQLLLSRRYLSFWMGCLYCLINVTFLCTFPTLYPFLLVWMPALSLSWENLPQKQDCIQTMLVNGFILSIVFLSQKPWGPSFIIQKVKNVLQNSMATMIILFKASPKYISTTALLLYSKLLTKPSKCSNIPYHL